MAFSATATRVFQLADVWLDSGAFGVVPQADGSYIAGLSEGSEDFPFTNTGRWYRSTNDGVSWSAVATTVGVPGSTWRFPANIHENIVVAPTFDLTNNKSSIVRTTNFGSTWSTVYGPLGPTPSLGRDVFIYGANSWNRTHAIAWGEFDGTNTDPPHTYALSTDAGATWTPQISWDIGDANDLCNAMGVATNGVAYAQYTKFTGFLRTSNFARTANYGSTWTVLSAPPGGTGTPPNRGAAITCFDESNLVLAGFIGTSPTDSIPGVWWSDDAGTSLNLVPAADIADWPSGAFITNCNEVKRLTRDACILTLDLVNTNGGTPWRISLDRGQTYPITVTQAGGVAKARQRPLGKIVVTRTGAILATLWGRSPPGLASLEIWRIIIDC